MDAATNASPAALRVATSVTERNVGISRACMRLFILITGAGVDCEAEIDEDGDVAELTGTFPSSLHRALAEVAEQAVLWNNACVAETVWSIDAATGEVTAIDADAGAEAA